MRPLKIKDRCTKKKLKKCEEVARTYDKIQTAYADVLDNSSKRRITFAAREAGTSGLSGIVLHNHNSPDSFFPLTPH